MENWKSESEAFGHMGRYLRPYLYGGKNSYGLGRQKWIKNLSIWGDSSNEMHDTSWKGQKESMEDLGF